MMLCTCEDAEVAAGGGFLMSLKHLPLQQHLKCCCWSLQVTMADTQ